jgi:alcohol dehydrogenase/propanol-preferring alcohol dehydrogenase
MNLQLPMLTIGARSLVGTYVGSYQEMKELMELVKDGKIDPVPVESKPVNEINGILDDLKNGKVPGLVSISHN